MSGYLEKGQWHTGWYDTQATQGEFVRADSAFRNWVTADGSSGYPAEPRRGDIVTGLPAESEDVKVFHAGTELRDGQPVTAGGRVLCVTALGDSTRLAQQRAYEVVRNISFAGAQYRHDIGQRALKR